MLVFAILAALQGAPVPSQHDLELALLLHDIRIATFPEACRGKRPAPGCIKPSKRIKVRNFDCQASGTDAKGQPILYCRVTYIRAGGSLANVQSNNECVPLRVIEVDTTHESLTSELWQVALVDTKGKCPGARE